MDRQVQLFLTGRQRDPEGHETVTELSAEAECFERNGSLFILYQEKAEDGTLTKNMIKRKDHILELTKKGSVNTCMTFEPGREHMTDYATPFGLLRLGILTDSVESRTEENSMEITADYTLTESGRMISQCNVSIKIHNILNKG